LGSKTTEEEIMHGIPSHLGRLLGISALGAMTLLIQVPQASADDVIIHMKSGPNRFQEKVVQVKVGDRVIWKNLAGTHTATPDSGQMDPFPDTGNLSSGRESTPWVVSGAPRTIKYHCEIHGTAMSGEIIVLP
jgi:plastocyanin